MRVGEREQIVRRGRSPGSRPPVAAGGAGRSPLQPRVERVDATKPRRATATRIEQGRSPVSRSAAHIDSPVPTRPAARPARACCSAGASGTAGRTGCTSASTSAATGGAMVRPARPGGTARGPAAIVVAAASERHARSRRAATTRSRATPPPHDTRVYIDIAWDVRWRGRRADRHRHGPRRRRPRRARRLHRRPATSGTSTASRTATRSTSSSALEALAVDLERRVTAREAPFDDATADALARPPRALDLGPLTRPRDA